MSYHITDEPDSMLGFVPEKHHVSATDSPHGHDPQGAKEAAQEIAEADPHETKEARKGASWAVENGSLIGDSMPFNPSVGLHSIGSDHADGFSKAIRDSGGVRQGDGWCSDAAPGVQRVVVEHSLTLDSLSKHDENKGLQDQGIGRTFETQRRSHWSHDRWGG